MRLKNQLTVLLSLVMLLFTSCAKEQKNLPRKPNTLRMNVIREPSTMDPRRGSEFIGATFHGMLFEGLTRLNSDYSVSVAQAKTIEISDDRKTYTFHLRQAKWSDGSPVTAIDFEKAWKKVLSPDFSAPNAPLFYPIKNAEEAKKGIVPVDEVGIYAIDEQTLVVELKNPTPYFLKLIAFCAFFPVKHTLDKLDPSWMNQAGENYLSNGPFKLHSWKQNNEIVLEKNPFYWESTMITLERIHVSMIKDEHTVLQMYENDEIDIIGDAISPIPNDAILKYHKKGVLKTFPSAATTAVSFNVAQFPFNNKAIRKAFAYAIDRKEIVDNITQLGEQVATQIIPSCLKAETAQSYFRDNNLKKSKYHFEKGLKQLGLTPEEFPILTYHYSFSELNHKLAQALQQQWAKNLGVKVQLQQCEHKVFLDRLGKRDYALAQMFWFAQYHDPMSVLERFKYKNNPKNYCNWENPTYITLLEQTASAINAKERSHLLDAAESLILEEMPLTPIYHWKTVFMVKDHVMYEEFPHDHGFFQLNRVGIKKTSQ
ncbi:MAG TPA: peptide ABC transporter substrate-binding protein [Rhabdochlamydiaceae bacterium]|nr:peptide ABC transporter substrate-binding protein [Rhabdochlamydiaceae bacterium]